MEERTTGGDTDLLMECAEDEEEEERHDEELKASVSAMEVEQVEVRLVSVPVESVSSCSSAGQDDRLQCSLAPLGFRLNGRLIPLLHGGVGAQLKLLRQPGRSVSGFTSVIDTTPAAAACPGPTPIITGVVSGEAAQRVLNGVTFRAPPSVPTPPSTSPQATPPTLARRLPRPAAPPKLLHKGGLGPVSPPDCPVCLSQYKLVMELRGFMCLCSPAISESLKNLKKNLKRRKKKKKKKKNKIQRPDRDRRTKTKTPPTVNGASPVQATHRPPEDFLSAPLTGPFSIASVCGPLAVKAEPQVDPLKGKLVIMVEDFYYGSARGRIRATTARRESGPFHCNYCPHTLSNNLRLMAHMRRHLSSMTHQNGHTHTQTPSCQTCLRRFTSTFKLKRHKETTHNPDPTALCKICELAFDSEPDFLWHMKSMHKPGEMPYVCQVCDFRSSFYSDVWTHFSHAHANSEHLLCQYCLKVQCSSSSYQQHVARHQKKSVFSCDKCRLHFLYIKERLEHQQLHHRTHVRPPQLSGLRPGTKVTVRTYSVVRGCEGEDKQKRTRPCKVVNVDLPPHTQALPRRRLVQSLGPLLSNLSRDNEEDARQSQLCIECLSFVRDVGSHFPSLVHCSLCRFLTCCSTSYANHMINNHTTCGKKRLYPTIFLSSPRFPQRLRCVSCHFTTCSGDMMASHLTERPEHQYSVLSEHESNANCHQTTNTQPTTEPCRVKGGGAFIPIHLLPLGHTSTQLSVKALTSPSPLSSPAAMTIRILGPRPQQPGQSPLSASQLLAVLSALCHGLPAAACRHHTSPFAISSWIAEHERRPGSWPWDGRTDKMAEWVSSQREQQLSVSEDVLLQVARKAVGGAGHMIDFYSWAVDFLLTYRLAAPPVPIEIHHRGRLASKIRDNLHVFLQLLSAQIVGKSVPPDRVASMDEFSIFVDFSGSAQSPAALRLTGSPEEKPTFNVVLSALSDGTFLRPLLFVRGNTSQVPDGFPDNVLLRARPDGFTDKDCQRIWINEVWRPHVYSGLQSVLVVDVHRGHLLDEFRSTLTSMSTDVFFIPTGSCCHLQPLDVCVTPVLHSVLQAWWSQLVSQEVLGLDQLALMVACWFSELSSMLNSEKLVLRRSFALAAQEADGRQEAAQMIHALTKALIQPPETPGPGPGPELLLLMKEEQVEERMLA